MTSHQRRLAYGLAGIVVVLIASLGCQPAETGNAPSALGIETVRVPQVVGLTAELASERLQTLGLVPLVRVGQAQSPTVSPQTIYDVQPREGTDLARGSQVFLLAQRDPDVPANSEPSASHSTAPQDSNSPPSLPITEAQPPVAKAQPPASSPGPLALAPAEVPNVAQGTPPQAATTEVSAVATSHDPLPEPRWQVEPWTGGLHLAVHDLHVAAGPLSLDVTRGYLPDNTRVGLLGKRWRLNWERRVERAENLAAIRGTRSLLLLGQSDSSDLYRSAAGDELRFTADGAIFQPVEGPRETYDAQGKLLTIEGPAPHVIRLHYESDGRLKRVEGPFGAFLNFQVEPGRGLVAIESSTGARILYLRPNDTLADDDAPRALRYSYDARGWLSEAIHPDLGSIQWSYDPQGRVQREQHADGGASTWVRDDASHAVTHTGPTGQQSSWRISADGRSMETRTPDDGVSRLEFNARGLPVSLTGPTGLVSRLAYDPRNRLTRVESETSGSYAFEYEAASPEVRTVTDPVGRRWIIEQDPQQNLRGLRLAGEERPAGEIEYDPQGLPRTIRHPDGSTTTLEHDAQGRITRLTDDAGRVGLFEYDPAGRLLRYTDPLGNVVSRQYDPRGRLTQITDATGATRRFQHDAAGRIVQVTDPLGQATRFTYDLRGRLLTRTDALGRAWRWTYDLNGRVTSVTDPNGATNQLVTDPAGRVVRQTNPLGEVTTIEYDLTGRVTRVQGGSQTPTQFTYDPAGRLASITDPRGLVERFEVDQLGRPTAWVDSYGRRSIKAYDLRGNLERTTRPNGRSHTRRYDPLDRLIELSEDGEPRVSFEYDAAGQLTRRREQSGLDTSYRYDPLGRLSEWRDNLGRGGRVEYDAEGRPRAFVDSQGGRAQVEYDAAGQIVSLTNALQQVKRLRHDAVGQLVEVVEPNGDAVRYGYDPGGRITRVQLPGGGQRAFQYNALGQTISSTDAAGHVSRWDYDPAGRLSRSTDALGRTTTLHYDAASRLVEKRRDDGSSVRYQYGPRGELAAIDDAAFPIRYTYDERGRRTSIEYPAIPATIRYEYDPLDRLSRQIAPGLDVRYTYDAFDRLATIDVGGAGTFRMSYDPLGRRTGIEYPNGVRALRTFDAAGNVTGLVYHDPAGTPRAGVRHTYDLAGNETAADDLTGSRTTYRYDAAGQIIEEQHSTRGTTRYGYAPGGNRLRRESAGQVVEYASDADDRLSRAGDETLQYDACGNLVERASPRGKTVYRYNADQRLIEVMLPSGEPIRYGYDANGARIWRESKGQRTWYLTDGLDVLAELNAAGEVQATFVQGPGLDDRLARGHGGEFDYLHPDRRGSIRNRSDGRGELTAVGEYGPFGEPRLAADSEGGVAAFAGRDFDPATGLYYFRARWYDPELGRFLSKDPVAAPLLAPRSLNPYLYVANHPVGLVDPLGAAGINPNVTLNANTLGDSLSPLGTNPSLSSPTLNALSPPQYTPTLSYNGEAPVTMSSPGGPAPTLTSPPGAPAPTLTSPPGGISPEAWPRMGHTPEWMKALRSSPEYIHQHGLDLGYDYYSDRSLGTLTEAWESRIRGIHENFVRQVNEYTQRGKPHLVDANLRANYFEAIAEEAAQLDLLRDEAMRRGTGLPPADDYFRGLREYEARFPPELPPEARPPAPTIPPGGGGPAPPASNNGSRWTQLGQGIRGAMNAFMEPKVTAGNVTSGVINGALVPANVILDVYGDNKTVGESLLHQVKTMAKLAPVIIILTASGAGEVILVAAIGGTAYRGYRILNGEDIVIPEEQIAVARDPNDLRRMVKNIEALRTIQSQFEALQEGGKRRPLNPVETQSLVNYLQGLGPTGEPQLVEVPPIEGLTPDAASGAVKGVLLSPDPIPLKQLPNGAKPGIVLLQDPKPKTMVSLGSSVKFYYSQSKPVEKTVKVPNLVTKTLADAEALLKDPMLKLVGAPAAGDKMPSMSNKRTEVYEQTPQAGTEVAEGTTVSFKYYAGIKVDNYLNMKRKEATAKIAALNLVPDVQPGDQKTAELTQRNRIYRQKPLPGEYVWFGDTIEARYYGFDEGFREGDGAKVDGRVAAAQVNVSKAYEDIAAPGTGTMIEFHTGPQAHNNETAPLIGWSIVKCADAGTSAKLLADGVKVLPKSANGNGFSSESSSGGNGYSFTSRLNSPLNKATAHGRMEIYRGVFIINYGFVIPNPAADVSHATGIMQRSRALIDLRFPPDGDD